MTSVTIQLALLSLILNLVGVQYIEKLKVKRAKYAAITPYDLLQHLWITYGSVKISDLSENETIMKQPCYPPSPIKDLFRQLKDI